MAVEGRQDRWAFKAGADLTAAQYKAVKLDANGNIVLAGAGEAAVGILVDMPAAGEYGTVAVDGIAKAVAGGAVTPGVLLAADANGAVVAAVAGNHIIGQALSGASAAGELVTLVLARGVA